MKETRDEAREESSRNLMVELDFEEAIESEEQMRLVLYLFCCWGREGRRGGGGVRMVVIILQCVLKVNRLTSFCVK